VDIAENGSDDRGVMRQALTFIARDTQAKPRSITSNVIARAGR
jgi:hypothetical protein